MKMSGSLDDMCGVYSYRIEEPALSSPPPPPPPPSKKPRTLGEQRCYDKPAEHHADVFWMDQEAGAKFFCVDSSYRLKPGNPTIAIPQYFPEIKIHNAIMSYFASWIEGCEIEGEASQPFLDPVRGWTCEQLMIENYKNCEGPATFCETDYSYRC